MRETYISKSIWKWAALWLGVLTLAAWLSPVSLNADDKKKKEEGRSCGKRRQD